MLNKLADLLNDNEKLSFQLSNLGSGVYKLVMSFQPMALPKNTVTTSDDKAVVEGLLASADLIRAELAKPKVFTGIPDEICDQLDQLLTITQSSAYQRGVTALSTMVSSIEKTIADAQKKADEAKTKKATKTTSTTNAKAAVGCADGSCDADDEQPDLFGE
jgi:hypothetical protein